ncbi:MAG: hypothetical protein KH100_06030 [Dysgonomonas mossii]|uniref:hypothetical protein n=1 Tax=Dysgonomonas mossii TaxID=163665 RepID=UPI001D7F2364|nr:hypothetical protein [Dysgonomonas mossii]MBS5797351.1 hypothetical protein [Dysgonomonas mossii]MBS7110745.1 hypothetical protein [Dysgonomonas mossii]
MAIAIKNIPTLRDKVASDFVQKANVAVKERSSIDFSKKVAIAHSILQKAKMI